MRVLDLFSGIGGFSLAFDRAGCETVAFCECDRDAQSVLRRHWPAVQMHDDVCKLNGAQYRGQVDVVTFGSPCQDLSVAGKRKGLVGERSGLFFEAIRIVGQCQPAFAVWENVAGALSSNAGRDFAAVLGAFRELGARDISGRILDAQHFGVPQRRRRIFVVADFRGERAAEILFERAGLRGDFAARRATGQGVSQALTCGFGNGGADDNRAQAGFIVPEVAWSLQERGAKGPDSDTKDGHLIVSSVTSKWAKGSVGPAGDETQNLLAETSDMRPCVAFQPRYFTRDNKTGNADSCSERTVLPIRASSANGDSETHIATAMAVRRLTPRECSRLQGFPDDWTRYRDDGTEISDSARYRILGNAVAVPVVEWIAKRMAAQCAWQHSSPE